MKSNKLIVRIILGVLALALVAGMMFSFLPLLNSSQTAQRGTPVMKVNGVTITDAELEQLRAGNPLFSLSSEGVIGDDLKTLLVSTAIQRAVLNQDAEKVRVSNGDVNAEVQKIREQNGLTKNQDWAAALQQTGRTDASFRKEVRESLAVQKRAEEVQQGITVTEAEAKAYYDLHPEEYQSEPRVQVRVIGVDSEAKAKQIRQQAAGGADFAELAEQNGAANGGAVGGGDGKTLKPVEQLGIQQREVADAVFALGKPGLTDVIKSGNKYYVAKVERFLPAQTKPFAEVKAAATSAVEQQKKNAKIEAWLEGLNNSAKVEVLDKTWAYNNPVVAKVGKDEIRYADLVSALYSNQQIAQVLQQGPQAESFVNQFFKPQVLDGLINQRVAAQLAREEKRPFEGSRAEVLASYQLWATRDVKPTEAEIRAFYEQNKDQFTVKGSADLTTATFKDRKSASDFLTSYAANPGNFTQAAAKARGTVNEIGKFEEGDERVNPVFQKAVLESGRLKPAGDGSLSDVLEADGKFVVLYVKDVVKPTTRSLAEVREQVEAAVTSQKRQAEAQAFIAKQREKVKVENNLEKVLEQQQARVDAESAKPPADPAAEEGAGSKDSEPAEGEQPATEEPAGH
ncbi:peptidyl-prolyl cis-trans isomerase [Deinobacterium chartae]